MRRFLNVLYADFRRLVRLPAFWLLLLCFALLSPLPLLLKLPRLLSGYYRGFDATDGLLSFLPFIGLALAILLPFYLHKTDVHKREMGLSNAKTYLSNLIVLFTAGIALSLAALLTFLLSAELITLYCLHTPLHTEVYWFTQTTGLARDLVGALCNVVAHSALALSVCVFFTRRWVRFSLGIGVQLLLPVLSVIVLPPLSGWLLQSRFVGSILEYFGLLCRALRQLLPSTVGLSIGAEDLLDFPISRYCPLFSLILTVLVSIPCLVPTPADKNVPESAELTLQ